MIGLPGSNWPCCFSPFVEAVSPLLSAVGCALCRCFLLRGAWNRRRRAVMTTGARRGTLVSFVFRSLPRERSNLQAAGFDCIFGRHAGMSGRLRLRPFIETRGLSAKHPAIPSRRPSPSEGVLLIRREPSACAREPKNPRLVSFQGSGRRDTVAERAGHRRSDVFHGPGGEHDVEQDDSLHPASLRGRARCLGEKEGRPLVSPGRRRPSYLSRAR